MARLFTGATSDFVDQTLDSSLPAPRPSDRSRPQRTLRRGHRRRLATTLSASRPSLGHVGAKSTVAAAVYVRAIGPHWLSTHYNGHCLRDVQCTVCTNWRTEIRASNLITTQCQLSHMIRYDDFVCQLSCGFSMNSVYTYVRLCLHKNICLPIAGQIHLLSPCKLLCSRRLIFASIHQDHPDINATYSHHTLTCLLWPAVAALEHKPLVTT